MDCMTTETMKEAALVRSELTEGFNATIGEFTRKLISTYPDDGDSFKTLYHKMLFAMAADKECVIAGMCDAILPLLPRIEAKDDSLFDDGSTLMGMPMFAAVNMSRNWAASGEKTKQALWSYMGGLTTMCHLYQAEAARCEGREFRLKTPRPVTEEDLFDDPTQPAGFENMPTAEEVHNMIAKVRTSLMENPDDQTQATLSRAVAEGMGVDLATLDPAELDGVNEEAHRLLTSLLGVETTATQLTNQVIGDLKLLLKGEKG
jgi:hypothetical protein